MYSGNYFTVSTRKGNAEISTQIAECLRKNEASVFDSEISGSV